MKNKKHQQYIRIFKNPVLEALTRTSPLVTILVYIPLILFLLWTSSGNQIPFTKTVLIFIAGVFFWTFVEYFLHRYIFHFYSESNIGKRLHYIIHGVHHNYPKSTDKLFMPPVAGLAMSGALYLILSSFLGKLTFVFLPGLITGYLIYVFLHYFIHTSRPPKMFRKLWIHHHLHHHKYPERCFGVSTHIWDRIFKTMPPERVKS